MKITILAIGRLKSGPLYDLYKFYMHRIQRDISLKEIDLKHSTEMSVAERKEKEAAAIQSRLPDHAYIVSLDEHGKLVNSLQFAQLMEHCCNHSLLLTFIIGGADGLAPSIHKLSHQIIAFGHCTWPHMMARILLLEQLYRGQQLLAGHPYHRE